MAASFDGNDRDRYLKGIALFNQQEYFAAHEVWEALWKRASGQEKLFYQGLIQCAISLEHMKRGNAAGARALFRRCHARMAPLPRVHMGLEIWSLMEATARALAPRIDPPGNTGSGEKPADCRRRSGQMTRKLRLLRAHGLIHKLAHTHRYVVSEKGRRLIAAMAAVRNADIAQLTKAA